MASLVLLLLAIAGTVSTAAHRIAPSITSYTSSLPVIHKLAAVARRRELSPEDFVELNELLKNTHIKVDVPVSASSPSNATRWPFVCKRRETPHV